MKRAKLQAAVVGGTPDDIEQAFYEALHNADSRTDLALRVRLRGPAPEGAEVDQMQLEEMAPEGPVTVITLSPPDLSCTPLGMSLAMSAEITMPLP